MKTRIFSIMDMRKKKGGIAVLCGVMTLTLATGAAFAANVQTPNPSEDTKGITEINPYIGAAFNPDPVVYAPYAAYGITVSEDGTKLLYQGRPVRLFVDEKSDTEAFYLDGAGEQNLSAVRDAAGKLAGIKSIPAQQAQEYQDAFFAQELSPGFLDQVNVEARGEFEEDFVRETVEVDANKYGKYQPYGITYSATDEILYYNGQRVKFFIDRRAGEGADALWSDPAGTVNMAVVRDASGQITRIESISDEKAREYQSASEKYEQEALNGLDEKISNKIANSGLEEELTAKMKKLYPNGIK